MLADVVRQDDHLRSLLIAAIWIMAAVWVVRRVLRPRRLSAEEAAARSCPDCKYFAAPADDACRKCGRPLEAARSQA